MATPKEHIEELRKKRFWIGVGEKNPLSKTVCMSVKYLSAELYSKDVHFLMELIQNAEDNEYPEGVKPSLEFIITSQDITATGAPATLLIFNNEKGFSPKNMESICNVGDSTKVGNRKRGYIGEKGIGFKSVFLLTAQPYIFSNGYQIRFSETPCPECDIAYIVPEWVDSESLVSDIQKIYGPVALPTTTIILPLKSDKVKAVKDQLSNIHPELLLFLSKIKQLSVREDNLDSQLNTIRAISISSERDVVAKKNIDAESYTVDLNAKEEGDQMEEKCWYYMWRQRFPVKRQNKVEKRMDMEELTITLAFPWGDRLTRGMSSVGIYAFLPTETVTNLPFIIQADFLLPSSRETILWDNVWNQGILDCVPTAFINAFVSLVKTRADAPASTLAKMFAFLPVNDSCHPKLNTVRESIRAKVLQENIIPSESSSKQKFFHKPGEVWRLMPSFWNILAKAKDGGAKLHNLSFEGKHILNSSFDFDEYDNVLKFLGIKFVDNEWYPKCIHRCNLVLGVGEDVYKELLHFVAVNWKSDFDGTTMRSIPLLKYIDTFGNVSLLSINEARGQSILCRSQDSEYTSWLIDWSLQLKCEGKFFFLPKRTQELCSGVNALYIWLGNTACVKTLSVHGYASLLLKSLGWNRALVLAFAHFLYHSYSKGFVTRSEVALLCGEMPLLNAHGGVSMKQNGVLVPANGSKWVELIGSNPWGNEKYVELAQDYLLSGQYAGQFLPQKVLMDFLKRFTGASDIPDLYPPNATFPTVYGPMTKQNAFLLLDWIRALRSKRNAIPRKFISCIKEGSWLKVTMSGCSGYKPPCESFLPHSSWGSLLQSGSDMVDIPLVDQGFYGSNILNYENELKEIGVMTESAQACEFIGKHLMSLASNYNLTKTKVLAMLNFVRFLRLRYLPVDEFIDSIKNVDWVRTSCGEKSPDETVLYDQSWEPAKAISQIPFIDQDYYGEGIFAYKAELKLLGVTISFEDDYQIVVNNLKSLGSLSCLKAEHLIFALKCIRYSSSSHKVVASLMGAKCLRTSTGHYLCPAECFLFDSEWGCILKVFEGFSYVDVDFYGQKIFEYRDELRRIGVVVDFDLASKAFFNKFKQQASSKCITSEQVLSFLACYRKLGEKLRAFSDDIRASIHETKWLRSRLGDYRSPKDCILFNSDWGPISQITLLPFIDDSDKGYGKGIHNYKDELKRMGVVVDLEKGSHFVLSNIFFPRDPTTVTPSSVYSLLQCIRNYKPAQNSLREPFLDQIRQRKWLKTTLGYMSPRECLLFDTKQKCSLFMQDGPFIDEDYYGSSISSYREELAATGVTVHLSSSDASSLIAQHIKSHSDLMKIERIYSFLSESNWKPGKEGAQGMIWIPDSSDNGMWVSPEACVLHDDNDLFSSRFHVLDQKKYKPKLLLFFSSALGVRNRPATDDYLTLWKEWEDTREVILHEECCAFWGHVIKHMNQKTEKMISECLVKIPAVVHGNSGDIHLRPKQDVFLPDDLLLKDLFEKSSPEALFVWYPTRNLPGIARDKLFGVYAKIGVRTISESVSVSELCTLKCEELNQVNPNDSPMSKGLVMLILGFLAHPSINLEVKQRHEAVKKLLKLGVFETPEPIMMSYRLEMSSGDAVKVSATRMVHWEKENSEFYTQKLDISMGYRNIVEYATNFAQVVSEGLLWEKEDRIPMLSELIKFGFLMNFDEDAVTYFMKSNKLEIFEEDEEFCLLHFPLTKQGTLDGLDCDE